MTDIVSARKWYREPYVWLVVCFPLLAVIGGVITAWLAVRSDDGLVADDYYNRGLEINKTLARDKAAQLYGLEATVTISEDKNMLQVTLRSNGHFRHPEEITLTFMHPTRAGLDRRVMLKRVSADVYAVKLPGLTANRWYVQMEADDWRILQTLDTAKH